MANYIVTKQLGVVVFILILVHWGWCKNSNCDVNRCKSLFSTVFKDFLKKGTQRLCRSLDEDIECVNECFQIFFPDFDLVNSKTSIASEVCRDDFEYDLSKHWNCISGHFHRLLTCMSISGSMAPTNITSETLKLLSCRKLLEVLNCPYKILHDCEDEAIEIVNELFKKVFKASMDSACYPMPSYVAFDLPVTYSLKNSYLSISACLDSFPNAAGNCFSQYLQNFEADKLYDCRNTCENFNGQTCFPSSVMSDFYIPVLSFGKHSCEEDSAIEDKVQMQEPSKSSTVTYNSDVASEVHSKDGTSTTNPTDENEDLVPSDEAKRGDILSTDYNSVEDSTINYKPKAEETDHDKVLSTIHSSSNFSPHTSVATSKAYRENNSLSSGYAADNKTENNGASRFEYCLQYLVATFLAVLALL